MNVWSPKSRAQLKPARKRTETKVATQIFCHHISKLKTCTQANRNKDSYVMTFTHKYRDRNMYRCEQRQRNQYLYTNSVKDIGINTSAQTKRNQNTQSYEWSKDNCVHKRTKTHPPKHASHVQSCTCTCFWLTFTLSPPLSLTLGPKWQLCSRFHCLSHLRNDRSVQFWRASRGCTSKRTFRTWGIVGEQMQTSKGEPICVHVRF